ncbi:MAG TPA: 50S ribosomal protein L29 [Candidatus Koribacter sp.]|jgi:large subunit ribosomal protein L29
MAQAQSLADKVRNLTPAELHAREREQSEQLFKLKFQMKMGQTESVKKLRELKKEIARIKTVAREKELGVGPVVVVTPAPKAKPAKAKKKTAAKKTASKKTSRKKTEKK